MTLAVIDIGTNTVLLLVAHIDEAGRITPLVYEQRVPRLGRGVDAGRMLQPDAMNRVLEVLREYKGLAAQFAPMKTVVCGTSAVRDAANRDEFAALIRAGAGYDLEILSGEDEALWTYRGAISGLAGIARATVIDIGGGSTEITTGAGRKVLRRASRNVGSVRLTERFLSHDPPTASELASCTAFVRSALGDLTGFNFSGSALVGVAGTATSLAALIQGIRVFRRESVANFRLLKPALDRMYQSLITMSSADIRKLSDVMEGRADVVTAGALILVEFMTLHGFDEMIVSERGVRYGLALREWEQMRKKQDE